MQYPGETPRAEGHPQTGVASDAQAKKHSRQLLTLKHAACADVPKAHSSLQQSQQDAWFSSLPFQRFQALLTLFPKSFSSFPHGTCLLSVSSPYLALDEIYHLIYAPSAVPRSGSGRFQCGFQVKFRKVPVVPEGSAAVPQSNTGRFRFSACTQWLIF